MSDSEQRFTVTDEHVKLLRAAYVGWDECEFGAPAIDCKRPYGNSDVYGDMAMILDDYDPDEDRLAALHRETQTVLQIALSTGRLEPGEYVAPKYGYAWRAASRGASDTNTREDR